ncbi:uncharacterized protein F5Z01DRAFT_669023 [Emericellopsis atlantica]|uniref:Ankyrin repeat protein n=1 Tax=Emericellopsis atlantica TaxID=2614577 RepID=A0A9P7ZCY0_9HYPO|nr:uncharacterized protein F5Z01DRAFT_669023 [Emericellopsis atlantica]KAG9249517.1 hypothetical protein F5Z01DRAFT_669023 [Emericellopsis atlantica]
MASDMAMPDLPALPAHHEDLAQYIAANRSRNVNDLIQPYRQYENQLRAVFAQDRSNPVLEDPYINVLPLFNENTEHIKVRARNLEAESEEEKSKYIMPLSQDERRPDGSPATVRNLAEFQNNFNIFSESSLVDMDWSNVVAAGSSVINTLLPVPKEYTTTKRKLREYYHEKFCPASDVDLFLYGLNHEQAIEKIKQIEQSIRDALLNEVTVVRTKYAITIASQYPVRHVQIVLRVYKSISEILTGFDIDAAGGAFDGQQVWVTPRALASFITQTNHIDLSRRSPSYENRLSKYSHRGFEVYWADLDRSRIDPTIFERSFARTLGLARLLILERLPTSSAREAYLNRRRQERGRPSAYRQKFHLGGNIKDFYEDEVADWLSEEEVSNYHTFTVPYGEKFNAKRIEKLCYTRDLLLNAEWNQPKEREVYLHRHPAFFGRVQDVIEDCCGTCPVPKTEEEIEVAEKEAEIYISGKVSFLIDDPGRQQIGSFNPLTEQDWTDMAYVGNTARLCQSIVNGDLDDVLNWLAQPDADANTRDYTGRTPLHLAVMASTPDVVKALIDHRARITSRLADGRTALHLAASRGDTEMIKLLMDKSIENEEMEEERKDRRRAASKAAKPAANPPDGEDSQMRSDDEDEAEDKSDDEMTDYAQTETDAHSATTGSFIKIKDTSNNEDNRVDIVPDESDDDPDYYQIDILAWDVPSSPLHLAIVGGHEDAVKQLCDYGADSILPVKFSDNDSGSAAAILTLVLALSLPSSKAKSMARLLLSLGAISSQAETNGVTAFQRYVESDKLEMVDTLLEHDKAGVKSAINHLAFGGWNWSPQAAAPLHTAIETGNPLLVLKLLAAGASVQFDYETWLKSAKVSPTQSSRLGDLDRNKRQWRQMVQPLALAISHGHFEMALALLENGADPNTLTGESELLLIDTHRRSWNTGTSVLDDVNEIIKQLEKGTSEDRKTLEKPQKRPGLDEYMQNFQGGSYARWVAGRAVADAQKKFEASMTSYVNEVKKREEGEGETAEQVKFDALMELTQEFAKLRDALIAKGAKTFKELHPDIAKETSNHRTRTYGILSHHVYHTVPDSEQNKKPFEVRFQFQGVSDMTDARRDAYIEL